MTTDKHSNNVESGYIFTFEADFQEFRLWELLVTLLFAMIHIVLPSSAQAQLEAELSLILLNPENKFDIWFLIGKSTIQLNN